MKEANNRLNQEAYAMGKGDKRTKRGKIRRGTFGNARRRKRPKPEKNKQQPATPRPAP